MFSSVFYSFFYITMDIQVRSEFDTDRKRMEYGKYDNGGQIVSQISRYILVTILIKDFTVESLHNAAVVLELNEKYNISLAKRAAHLTIPKSWIRFPIL